MVLTRGIGGRMRAAATPRDALRRAADPRVIGGIVIMALSAYLGLVAVGGGPQTVTVAVATRDLPAGLDLQPDDVATREVVLDEPQRYLGASEAVGSLRAPVGQGELLPRSAVAPRVSALRVVAVPVDAQRLPPDIDRGALVDVWAVGGQPVLEAVPVVGVSDPERWAGSTASVVLAVPPDDVAQLLAATRDTTVDITSYQEAS